MLTMGYSIEDVQRASERIGAAGASLAEVARTFARATASAADATRSLCAACHELEQQRARRGKLIAQMRAKARGRDWRTVR